MSAFFLEARSLKEPRAATFSRGNLNCKKDKSYENQPGLSGSCGSDGCQDIFCVPLGRSALLRTSSRCLRVSRDQLTHPSKTHRGIL